MKRALLMLLLVSGSAGCLGYPRPYFTRVHGKADLGEEGKPVELGAAIVKECETWQGDTETVGHMHKTTTGKDGKYSMMVIGVAWNFKNFVTEGGCTSHVQRFICRPYCKKADAIDIDVLGK